VCTHVISAVPYMSIGLAGCSMDPRISRDARKLARTSRVIKKNEIPVYHSYDHSIEFEKSTDTNFDGLFLISFNV